MAKINDRPPAAVQADLDTLRIALDQQIPAKVLDKNVLIASWNIRHFGGLTEKWQSQPGDSPRRDLQALLSIAEIISRFDVVAVQEVKGNLKALRHLMRVLGPHWSLILTDVSKGASGNDERLAFLFDTRKVQLSGLACELVVPHEELNNIAPDALDRQFARTPYAVSFRSGGKTFILVTLHVLYGKTAKQRVPELRAIAGWMADWARDVNSWDHNLITLGDFNIDRKGDALYEAFTSSGLYVPEVMNEHARSIFSRGKQGSKAKFYDQIAWFNGSGGAPALSMNFVNGGSFDFVRSAMQSRGLTRSQLSWQLSDHYPLWAEFSVRD